MKSHMRMRKVNIYVQHSREQMEEFYNAPRNRFLNSNVDLATQQDVVERLHLAGAEPEGVLAMFFADESLVRRASDRLSRCPR